MPAPPESAHGPPNSAPPRTVVYIEDTPSNIDLVARILSLRPNITLRTAATGTDGIALVRDCVPDLVLLDMHLPDIDGLDVLAALKADATTMAIPVAALSADATRARIDRAIVGGAVAYITKPLSVNEFLVKLELLLGV